jgi:hypothetical protein
MTTGSGARNDCGSGARNDNGSGCHPAHDGGAPGGCSGPVAGRGRKEDHRRGASAVQMALLGSAHTVCELLGWEEEKAGL